jgi:predicted ATPase/class 3 adenylate cyclase
MARFDEPEKAMDVGAWLEKLGLERYEQAFRDNEIDADILSTLTSEDLDDLGIKLVGHRRKLLNAIESLSTGAGKHVGEPVCAPEADGRQRIEPLRAEAAQRSDAERRQLTVLFCDLVGSTALSTQLDPEDYQAIITAYNKCIAQVIAAHQGLIARYAGDGVLAYFGYPTAHEDDTDQAVRAGLALISAIGKLQDKVNTTLQVRMGIATGTVVVGDLIGQGAAQEQAVFGETPNLAARLQIFAEPGTVVICANTRRIAAGQFEYRDLGLIPLKGLTEPAPAWQVLRATEVESRFVARHAAKVKHPLGRDEEMEILQHRWRRAVQGEGQVVVLTGEPGIGKSHVALAVQEMLEGEPHITLRYFCSEHHSSSVLFPFINQLERAAGFQRGDSTEERFAKLKTLLGQSFTDAEQTAVLADLLALWASKPRFSPDLTPLKRKEMTLAALWSQFRGIAAQQSVLVIFEDVHWIDPTSLELLALGVERVAQNRALFLITARPEFVPPWPLHSHVTTIHLSRLGRRDGVALIGRVTGGKSLPEAVIDELLMRTDGVPLFIEELTKTLLESGLLQHRDDRYVLDGPLPSWAIPATLQGSLLARLDRLASAKEVAQIGATVGREFFYELLSAVSALPQNTLDQALNQLIRSELVFSRGEKPHTVYTFKHALMREAAYTGLLKTRRTELHAAIAHALEQHFPELVEAEPETLAWHLTEAGLVKRGAEYWLRAGRNAASTSANIEATAHLRRGIEATKRLPRSVEKDRLELDLQFALAPCLIVTQGPASTLTMTTFTRARELCERLGDPPEYLHVMYWLASAAAMRGELVRANETVAGLIALAEQRNDRAASLNARRGHALTLLLLGALVDSIDECRRAIELFVASNEAESIAARDAGQDAGAAARAVLSWGLWLHGEVDEAAEQLTTAIERADAVQHPHTQAYVFYYGSILHALRGEPAIAQSYAERCLALSDKYGFRQWRGLSRAVRDICVALVDPSTSVFDDVTSALNEYRKAGYQLGITSLFVLLCPALLLRAQPRAALEIVEQGLAIANHNDERVFEAELYRLKARALLADGAPDARTQAHALLDRALSVARRQDARALELRAAADLSALWIEEGDANG